METVRLRLLWLPQPQFAGYLLAEHLDLAADQGLRLRCEAADFRQGPVAALLAGDTELAVASPAHILESADPGALVWLLSLQQDSPLVYPVWRDSGIDTLQDLRGRRIAVWPGNEHLELQWLLHRAGVDPAAVDFLATPDTVSPFLRRQVDCAQMTCYHELHQAEAGAGGGEHFRLFRPREHDAALIKDGLVARRDWVAANPARIQALVNAVLAGWRRAFQDPDLALEVCLAARPDMDRKAQTRQFADIRELCLRGATLSHGLGYPDPGHVRRAWEAAARVGLALPAGDWPQLVDAGYWTAAPAPLRAPLAP